jgi:hypothetical protein
MGINPWLDKFNEARKQVNRLRVRTFCLTSVGERRYYKPSKPIATVVEWDSDDFLATPHIQGVEIYDYVDVVLWVEEFPTIILKDTTLRVDFSTMKIENKWLLEDMLEEDDCE